MNKRNFLITSIKTIAAMLGTGSLKAKVEQPPPGEKTRIKMLTRDGKLVWVDMQSKADPKPPITNEELYAWINPVKDARK